MRIVENTNNVDPEDEEPLAVEVSPPSSLAAFVLQYLAVV